MNARLIAATLFAAGLLPAADADLILHHAKVVTVDAGFSVREAVAIKSNRIVRVGSSREVLAAERGLHTRAIDLEGRTVLPGLIDSHLHPLEAALSEFRQPLPELDSIVAVQRYLRERMAKTPKGQWIVVPRTFPTRLRELRMPTRKDLDVVTDHPVMFDASYVVILNSYALKQCGIGRDTPAPPRGEIVRDETGEPNGILKNARSLVKGLEAAEEFSTAEKLRALRGMLGRYAAAGLTSVGDGAVEDPELFRTLRTEGGLPVRAVLTWWLDISRPTAELERVIRAAPYTTGTGDDWIKFGALKVNLRRRHDHRHGVPAPALRPLRTPALWQDRPRGPRPVLRRAGKVPGRVSCRARERLAGLRAHAGRRRHRCFSRHDRGARPGSPARA